MAKEQDDILNEVTEGEYKYGFVSDVETEMIGKGLNESVIRLISQIIRISCTMRPRNKR